MNPPYRPYTQGSSSFEDVSRVMRGEPKGLPRNYQLRRNGGEWEVILYVMTSKRRFTADMFSVLKCILFGWAFICFVLVWLFIVLLLQEGCIHLCLSSIRSYNERCANENKMKANLQN